MKFVDEARVKVQAGNGGRGCVSFRREKFVPFGGPDGGDGGHGGSVTFRSREGINTLVDFRVERTFRAQNGEPGGGRDMSGRGGEDTLVMVPVGTIVRDTETGEVLGDLAQADMELLVARGGKGDKKVIVKFRRRKHYLRQGTHRQQYTQVKITGISA